MVERLADHMDGTLEVDTIVKKHPRTGEIMYRRGQEILENVRVNCTWGKFIQMNTTESDQILDFYQQRLGVTEEGTKRVRRDTLTEWRNAQAAPAAWGWKELLVTVVLAVPVIYYGYEWFFGSEEEDPEDQKPVEDLRWLSLKASTPAGKKNVKGWIKEKYAHFMGWASKNKTAAWLVGGAAVLVGINVWNTCTYDSRDSDDGGGITNVMRDFVFPKKKKKEDPYKIIWIILGFIVIVIVLGGLAFYLTRQQGYRPVWDIENPRPRPYAPMGYPNPMAARRQGYEKFRRFQARQRLARRYY